MNLGWVDMDFNCSTVCQILLGLVGIWQKRLSKMVDHSKSKSTQPRFARRWVTLYVIFTLFDFLFIGLGHLATVCFLLLKSASASPVLMLEHLIFRVLVRVEVFMKVEVS